MSESATTATDTDSDTLIYSLSGTALSGTDSGFFTVASGGQIRIKSGAIFNHEAQSSYAVTLHVRDNKDAAGGHQRHKR